MLLDKTGTITLGQPELDRVVATDGIAANETLRLAASLDQLSAHPLAKALVAGAEEQNLVLSLPEQSEECSAAASRNRRPAHVLVGSRSWLREHGIEASLPSGLDGGTAKVLVGDRRRSSPASFLWTIVCARIERAVPHLRAAGVRHIALVTGDKPSVAEAVGETLGVDRVYAEQTPEQKLEVVRALRLNRTSGSSWSATASTTLPRSRWPMSASPWARSGHRLLGNRRRRHACRPVDRVADAVRIGDAAPHRPPERSAGMGVSLVAMVFAAAGYLQPVAARCCKKSSTSP